MMSTNWSHMMMTGLLLATVAGCADDRPARSGPSGHTAQRTEPRATTPDSVAGHTGQERATFIAFTKQEPEFRKHYERQFGDSGYSYNQFRPAYQHGFEFGLDGRYRDMDWQAVESEARRTWDESAMGQWDRYRDAVRFGWERGVVASRG